MRRQLQAPLAHATRKHTHSSDVNDGCTFSSSASATTAAWVSGRLDRLPRAVNAGHMNAGACHDETEAYLRVRSELVVRITAANWSALPSSIPHRVRLFGRVKHCDRAGYKQTHLSKVRAEFPSSAPSKADMAAGSSGEDPDMLRPRGESATAGRRPRRTSGLGARGSLPTRLQMDRASPQKLWHCGHRACAALLFSGAQAAACRSQSSLPLHCQARCACL